MKLYDEEKLNELAAWNYEKKVKIARADYEAVMDSVDPEWGKNRVVAGLNKEPSAAMEVHTAMQVLAAIIVFGNYCFSEREQDFLERTIDLEKDIINNLKHDCEAYFSDAVDVFKKYLDETQKDHLTEIMMLLATVDDHMSKRELKWINKLLMFII